MSRWVLTLKKRIEMNRGSRYLLQSWPPALYKFLDAKKGDHFTVDLDTKRDASERPQEGISMSMANDSGKLWIDALSCKQLRRGNATDMQESIF